MTHSGEAAWRGFGPNLQTDTDLMRKLERDYERLRDRPDNSDAAFDFFVTAEHLVEWHWADGPSRKSWRKSDLGALVSHLANGGKHFVATAAQHRSVADLVAEPSRPIDLGRAMPLYLIPEQPLGACLVVRLEDGREVALWEVAAVVLEAWWGELGERRAWDRSSVGPLPQTPITSSPQ